MLDWQIFSALTLDEEQYSAYTSEYDTVVKVVFRETICDDPTSSIALIIAASAASAVVLILIVLLVICKVKKRACFSDDRKIAVKKHSGKGLAEGHPGDANEDSPREKRAPAKVGPSIGVSQPARVNWQDPKELEAEEAKSHTVDMLSQIIAPADSTRVGFFDAE